MNSVMWSLHSGLGKDYNIEIPQGQKTITFIGVLHNSILASEILISQQNFQKLFQRSQVRPIT